MSAELGDIALSVKDLGISTLGSDRPVTPKELQENLFLTIARSKKEKPQSQIEDEYTNTEIPILQPLKSVNIVVTEKDWNTGKNVSKEVNIDEELTQDFEHLSRTHKLETETPKTQALQNMADQMLQGTAWAGQTRVVVMNKGEDPNAFVTPDGTIFVSQSLLNKLDCMDEIASVMAHEVEHLINKTFESRTKSHGIDKTGTGWIHEGASDQFTPSLLEKINLNAVALASAIQKVSGAERGVIHQGGIARASEIIGHILARHYRTSNKPHIPKARELQGQAPKTNLEIFNELVDYQKRGWGKPIDMKQLKDLLPKLHPKDLERAYHEMVNETFIRSKYKEGEITRGAFLAANEVIFKRLEAAGFSEGEILTFLISSADTLSLGIGSSKSCPNNLYLLKTPQQVEVMIDSLSKIESEKRLDQMAKLLFGKSINQDSRTYDDDYRRRLLNMIQYYFYIAGVEEREFGGVPINEELLIKSLVTIGRLYPDESRIGDNSRQDIGQQNTGILLAYVDRVYLAIPTQANTTVDETQLRDFFEKVKMAGMLINPQAIDRYIGDKTIQTIDGKLTLSKDNQQIVKDIFCQVFDYQPEVKEKTPEYTFARIDSFTEELRVALQNGEYGVRSRNNSIDTFIRDMRNYFEEYGVDDKARLSFIEYLDQNLNEINLNATYSINYLLASSKIGIPQPGDIENRQSIDQQQNGRLMKFNLKTLFALEFFQKDSDEFYSYMEKVMTDSGVNLSELDRDQVLNLCQGLLVFGNRGFWRDHEYLFYNQRDASFTSLARGVFPIADFERYFNLPFLKHLLDQREPLEFTSVKQLNEFIVQSLERSSILRKDEEKIDLFNDGYANLIFGRAVRENFLQILERGIPEQDFGDLYQFIDNHYSGGVIKDRLLAEINKLYLRSPNISLEDKVDYLMQFYDSIGPEGTVIIGDQITDLETYDWFRNKLGEKLEQYLKGSKIVTNLALSDFATSFLSGGFSKVFETSQSAQKDVRKNSTELAKAWFQHYFYGRPNSQGPVNYDQETGKFIFGKNTRTFFLTIADSIANLRNLTPLQRFAVSHKLLTDQYGALANEGNRNTLARVLVQSLGLKKGFIADTLATACKKAAAEWIAFPASRMIAPLLFRGLNLDSIDFRQLNKEEILQQEGKDEKTKYVRLDKIISASEIGRITRADTRQAAFFGIDFKDQPNSAMAQLAQECDRQYFLVNEVLTKLLAQASNQQENKQSPVSEIDPTLEAVISGVEASGALGVRALQLITQMMHFSPAMESRLSRTLDANPGLNKVLLWENLHKLALENPELAALLQKVKISNYLGGGSLYTTFAATLEENGKVEEIVLKMLNPNADRVINETHKIATGILEQVASKGGSNREFAETGLLLVNLAKKWCENDINDPNFAQDDDRFRSVVDSFNQSFGREVFTMPQRKFNIHELKSETKASGRTVNQFLQDSQINQQEKRAVVDLMSRFLAYQLKHAPQVNEGGKTYRLIHSDPHVGNYIIDMESGQPRISVIDRHMYLKVEEKDVEVLEKLISSGNDNDFVYSFLDRILDINSVPSEQRSGITSNIFGKLRLEYIKQRVRGKIDRLSLMKTMLSSISEAEVVEMVSAHVGSRRMDIPLNLRLMIRNIGAFQELGRRYGVDFEALYKQVA